MLDTAFDPTTWESDDQECRIYASNDPDFYVVVDKEDYPFLSRFRWSIHSQHDGRGPRKQYYLRRSVSDFHAPDGPAYINPETGYLTRNRHRVQRNVFLHLVIMLRKLADSKPGDHSNHPLDKHHHLVDHKDRNTRNCRRSNLRWLDHSKNQLNRNDYVAKRKRQRSARGRGHR